MPPEARRLWNQWKPPFVGTDSAVLLVDGMLPFLQQGPIPSTRRLLKDWKHASRRRWGGHGRARAGDARLVHRENPVRAPRGPPRRSAGQRRQVRGLADAGRSEAFRAARREVREVIHSLSSVPLDTVAKFEVRPALKPSERAARREVQRLPETSQRSSRSGSNGVRGLADAGLRSPPSQRAARRDPGAVTAPAGARLPRDPSESRPSPARQRRSLRMRMLSLLCSVLLDLHITCQAIKCPPIQKELMRTQAYHILLLNILHPFNPS